MRTLGPLLLGPLCLLACSPSVSPASSKPGSPAARPLIYFHDNYWHRDFVSRNYSFEVSCLSQALPSFMAQPPSAGLPRLLQPDLGR